ncbi:hypothetical protein Fcan01_28341 [Folsomia candida]|uniref:Uncharacterized protein n=1 Tax=Folsomia candida TaxID=158441 RepID=A0A226CU06_FOLCA|nr:hypothetical protein Fcan01_28341 [Folsomia candida]
MFLQQGTNIVIKPVQAKNNRVSLFLTYCIILIWLFNAFFVGSIFGGEFFAIFTSNRVPQVPQNLKELVQGTNIPISSFGRTITAQDGSAISTLKENIDSQLLERPEYSSELRKFLSALKHKIDWVYPRNIFEYARSMSINVNRSVTRPNIFAVVDTTSDLQLFESCLEFHNIFEILKHFQNVFKVSIFKKSGFGDGFGDGLFHQQGRSQQTERTIIPHWKLIALMVTLSSQTSS